MSDVTSMFLSSIVQPEDRWQPHYFPIDPEANLYFCAGVTAPGPKVSVCPFVIISFIEEYSQSEFNVIYSNNNTAKGLDFDKRLFYKTGPTENQ